MTRPKSRPRSATAKRRAVPSKKRSKSRRHSRRRSRGTPRYRGFNDNALLIVSSQVHDEVLRIAKGYVRKRFIWCPYNFKDHEKNAWALVGEDTSNFTPGTRPNPGWPAEWFGAMTTNINKNHVGLYFNELARETRWPAITNIRTYDYQNGDKIVDEFSKKQFERLVAHGIRVKHKKFANAIQRICVPTPTFDAVGLMQVSGQLRFSNDPGPIIDLFNSMSNYKFTDPDSILKNDDTYMFWQDVQSPDDENWVTLGPDDEPRIRKLPFGGQSGINLVIAGTTEILTAGQVFEIATSGKLGSAIKLAAYNYRPPVTIHDYIEVSHLERTVTLTPSRKSGGNVNFRIDNALKSMFSLVNGVYTDAMASLYIVAQAYDEKHDTGILSDDRKKTQKYENDFAPEGKLEDTEAKKAKIIGKKTEWNHADEVIAKLKEAYATYGKLNERVVVVTDYEMDDIIMLRFLSYFYAQVYVHLMKDGKDSDSSLVRYVYRLLSKNLPPHVHLLPPHLAAPGGVNLKAMKQHFDLRDGGFFEPPLSWMSFVGNVGKLL